jgi:hypothetical protein
MIGNKRQATTSKSNKTMAPLDLLLLVLLITFIIMAFAAVDSMASDDYEQICNVVKDS